MRNKVIFPLIATFLFFSAFANGQSWTGIIDPSRAIAWQPGIPGGVPNRTTVCTTLNPGAQQARSVLQSRLSQRPSRFPECGTYNLSPLLTLPATIASPFAAPDQLALLCI